MQYHILVLFVAALIAAGCGRIPARYDQAKFACGELNPDAHQNAGGLLQVLGETGEPQSAHVITAQWVTDQKTTELAVSRHGCILTPAAAGSLKVVTRDGRQGLLLHQPQGNVALPTPIRLKSFRELHYQVSCSKRDVKSLADLGLGLTWNQGQDTDFWQIETMTLIAQRRGEPSVRRVTLPVLAFLNQPSLTLAPIAWPDGTYALKIELTTLAGRVVDSETGCQIELDQTVPEAETRLHAVVSDGTSPLALKPSPSDSQTFYCIRGADPSGCDDPNAFAKAGAYINAPVSGAFILYSYSEDSAGNRSPLVREPFYRDQTPPALSVAWNNSHLQQGLTWSKEPGATYEAHIAAFDDSVDAGFMTGATLDASLECSVTVVDGAGATRGSSEAICQSQRCEGQSLQSWIPCDARTRFSFQKNSESNLFHSQVRFRVRSRDASGHESIAETGFWMHPQAWGMWSPDNNTRISSNSGRHDFLNDAFGNLFRFTGQLGPDDASRFPALSVKWPDQYGWSKTILIEDHGVPGASSASNDRYPTLGFSTQGTQRSLWYATYDLNQESYGLAEVPLHDWSSGETPASLSPHVRQVPTRILQTIAHPSELYLAGLANVMDASGHESIVFLMRSFQGIYAFIDFDGSDFHLLNVTKDVPNLVSMKSDLVPGPDGQSLLFVLGNQLASFHLKTHAIHLPDDRSPVRKNFRAIRRDDQGYFGYTDQHELFTAQFNADATEFAVALLATLPPLLFVPTLDIDPFSHIVRTNAGDFWLSALSEGQVPRLFRLRPGLDRQWQSQNALWGWTNQLHAFGTFALGWDPRSERLYFATSDSHAAIGGQNPLILRNLMTCDFMDVTEQGAFRTDQKSNPTFRVFLNQDAEGNLWRAQALVNLQIAVSRMDETAEARVFTVDSSVFADVVQTPDNLLLASQGSFFLPRSSLTEEPQSFVRLDRESGVTPNALQLPKSRRRSFFDQAGSVWTLTTHDIQVRRKDGSTGSITVPEPWIGFNMNLSSPGKAWMSAFAESPTEASGKVWTLFELDLVQEKVQVDREAKELRFEVADMVAHGQRRLALVRVPVAGMDATANLPRLQVYEANGQGWLPRPSELQPRLPAWHPKKNELISNGFREDVHFFLEPQTQALWITAADSYNRPLLARFDGQAWHFFDPEKHPIKQPVIQIHADRKGLIYLRTREQVFLYNRACSS